MLSIENYFFLERTKEFGWRTFILHYKYNIGLEVNLSEDWNFQKKKN